MDVSLPDAVPLRSNPDRREAMMAKAQELEASFLAEMLGHAGLGEARETFGGGHGEDQFTSFLKEEQAKLMVQRGGIGLAELIFKSMTRAEDAK
ncbi:rod-binding protein [Tabrizicola sp.]|uniref:rod-binding protein n=1 Tax=Tabrizicola sp. TaxID=2005166 RepID=UPI00386AF51B